MNASIMGLAQGASMLVLYGVMFLVAKYLRQAITRYRVDEQLTLDDNVAVAASTAGYYLGATILFCGAYLGPSYGFVGDIVLVGGYTLLGLVLLLLARWINDVCVLPGFSAAQAIAREHNAAAGIVLGANYVASALIVAGAIQGEGGGVLSALVFYALGQIALVVFALIYDRLTPYRLGREIREGNIAAALGFGGNLIALGLVLMAGTKGDLVSWQYNLTQFALVAASVFVYLLIVRLFFDKLVITASDLNHEIAADRNIGAGLLEMTVAIGFAAVLFFMVR